MKLNILSTKTKRTSGRTLRITKFALIESDGLLRWINSSKKVIILKYCWHYDFVSKRIRLCRGQSVKNFIDPKIYNYYKTDYDLIRTSGSDLHDMSRLIVLSILYIFVVLVFLLKIKKQSPFLKNKVQQEKFLTL